MIKKLMTVLIAAVMMPIAALALTPQEVINKTAQKINTAPALTAKFSGSASGALTASGKKFSVIADGFGIWYNGEDMWSYTANTGETSLSIPTSAELIETNPLEIIRNNSNKFSAAKVSESNTKYVIKLTPKSKVDNVKSALLTISTKTWLPEAIDITMQNGQHFAVTISHMQISSGKLPDNKFDYPATLYPGVEVVDLR